MTRTYVICELAFGEEDPQRPGYSLREVDKYAHAPGAAALSQHRLSLRRNLITGAWEYYVYYHVSRVELVLFSGSLTDALAWGNSAWRVTWGRGLSDREVTDVPCDHSPHRESTCGRIARRDVETVR